MNYYQNVNKIKTNYNTDKISINEEKIDKLLSNFYESRNSSETSIPNYDSYAFLLLLFTKWVKRYHNEVEVELFNKYQTKLKISKKVGKSELINFCKLFEELTLIKFYVLDDDISNQWICDLFF